MLRRWSGVLRIGRLVPSASTMADHNLLKSFAAISLLTTETPKIYGIDARMYLVFLISAMTDIQQTLPIIDHRLLHHMIIGDVIN